MARDGLVIMKNRNKFYQIKSYTKRTFKIEEKDVTGVPTLFVLSNSGVLVKYEFFNLMDGFASLYQGIKPVNMTSSA